MRSMDYWQGSRKSGGKRKPSASDILRVVAAMLFLVFLYVVLWLVAIEEGMEDPHETVSQGSGDNVGLVSPPVSHLVGDVSHP